MIREKPPRKGGSYKEAFLKKNKRISKEKLKGMSIDNMREQKERIKAKIYARDDMDMIRKSCELGHIELDHYFLMHRRQVCFGNALNNYLRDVLNEQSGESLYVYYLRALRSYEGISP